MTLSRRTAWQAALALGLGASAPALWAQTGPAQYPHKPIRLVVPYPAGGGTDTLARILATQLGQAWGVSVVVDNKPGASGILGNDLVAKAPADGYTVLVAITALIQAPALYAKVPYDPLRDFSPVSQLATSSDLFVVPASSPAKTLAEFIALAKARPGKLNYGTYGNGTSSHLHGELFKMAAGIDLISVPYKGAGPEVNDLLGGQLDSAFVDATSINPHLRSDRLRVLGLTGTQRHPALPDVPTLGEQGLKGFEANGWFGVFLPAGTPRPIVDKLSTEVQRIVAGAELNSRLKAMGLTPVGGSPEQLQAVLSNDQPRWEKIVRDARISLE
ncbi:tripartite tricarboxylate transporter substrate binding protein [Curvibacter sp. HBC61]|uniref:Tripartite tricarboxylate transporter substrate binding protein n=1 Tax=Curvibacter cyanobacteriorum TaxID=3026422 RepID=A0ABT5MUC7_9BURK|nr:tripartite tricarboxylate transporter substrate binding protein [Curvibacter sp. HBC61]MDD0837646.1 tripartite tricarboxylate transporter substrate binding protein [Curvibacter sp. HBC61]